MKRIAILFGLLCGSVLLANPVFANDAAQLQCEAQAAAKKLAGAAKTSFVGKCVKDATSAATGECEKAAADKKLAGAANPVCWANTCRLVLNEVKPNVYRES